MNLKKNKNLFLLSHFAFFQLNSIGKRKYVKNKEDKGAEAVISLRDIMNSVNTMNTRLTNLENNVQNSRKPSGAQQFFYVASASLIIILGVLLVWKFLLQPKKKAFDLSHDVTNLIKEGDALEKKYKKK